MPKPSTASRTPMPRSWSSGRTASGPRSTSAVSATSSTSDAGSESGGSQSGADVGRPADRRAADERDRLTEIDSGGEWGNSRCQVAAVRQAVCSTQRPMPAMAPVSSARGTKRSGARMPRRACSQRTSASKPCDPAAGQVDDRLVGQVQLAPVGGTPQVVLQVQPFQRRRPHGRVEQRPASPPGRLGLVHGDVGVAEQGRWASSSGSATATPMLAPTTSERPATDTGAASAASTRSAMALASAVMSATSSPAGDQHGELVSAQAGHGVGRADRGPHPGGDDAQQVVAGLVAQRVVHALEPVEVDEQDGGDEAGVAPGPMDRLGHPVPEADPVGQAGQCIVEGLVLDGGLGLLAVGHVVHVDDHPAHGRIVEQVHEAGRGPQRRPVDVVDPQLEAVDPPRLAQGVGEGGPGPALVGGADPGEDRRALGGQRRPARRSWPRPATRW